MELNSINRTWFEVKAKYVNGDQKITEVLCIDTETFGDAENKALEHIAPYVDGSDTLIVSVSRASYTDFVRDEEKICDNFYKVTIAFVFVDEKTGKYKKEKTVLLVEADDFDEARKITEEYMKPSLLEWQVSGIVETSITEVIWK